MLTAIFNVLPEWAVGALLAALVWFGANYVWLAPVVFTKGAKPAACRTHLELYGGEGARVDMALHTSTFGFYGNANGIIRRACAGVS